LGYVHTLKTWHEAKAYCKSVEGYLATVTSQSEMDFILNTFGDANHTWLGGTDEEQEGVWKWVTGETWGYASWNSGQPDNEGGMGPENYVVMVAGWGGKWSDGANVNSMPTIPFICEWDGILTDTCKDSDNDGVPDTSDKCPDTPTGSYVDKNGCPATGLYTQAQSDQAVKAEQLKWDANGDGRIGLEDIIRMLQVIAGLRP